MIIGAASSSFAFQLKCDAAVGPRTGRESVDVEVTYQKNQAFIYKTIGDYTFNGSCGPETCDISISSEKLKGFISTNGAFSKLNDNAISISYFNDKDEVIEIECVKVK